MDDNQSLKDALRRGDLKEVFEAYNKEHYVIIALYDGIIADVFCSEDQSEADQIFEKMKKDETEDYRVYFKICNNIAWVYELLEG